MQHAKPAGSWQSAPRREGALTFVLVHGAFHGAWCWRGVAERLQDMGHRVFTPNWTGLGERAHLLRTRPNLETWIEDVAQVIRYEELEDIILVGHSFAGSIVSALADRMPERLRRIVYLDAMVLESGQSPADLAPPGHIEKYQARAAAGDGISVPPNPPEYYGITDPAMQAWFTPKLTPHPVQSFIDRLELKNPLGNGVPATYIAVTEPFFATTRSSRDRARAMPGWTWLELPTAHNAMTLMPERLTEMLANIETLKSVPSTEAP